MSGVSRGRKAAPDLMAALGPLLPPRARTVILGVGSYLRRDDYAGMAAAEALAPLSDGRRILILGGGAAPENFTGQIRAFAPDALIVIDAAFIGLAPGEYALIDPARITGATFSTHMLPLPVTLSYLEASCGCTSAYIGIEPVSVDPGTGLSAPVRSGVSRLARELAHAVRKNAPPPEQMN